MTPLQDKLYRTMPHPPFEALIHALSQKCAYPVTVDQIDVRHTHISTVFLVDDLVYKIKKPVRLSFLDFSTVELRRHFCEEEVRINRAWAPDVYLGVVPVTMGESGPQFEGTGPVIDWAVKMRRMPDQATLRARLLRDELTADDLVRVARRIASIQNQAPRFRGPEASAAETSFRHMLMDNWSFARDQRPPIIPEEVVDRLEQLSHEWLDRLDATLQKRAQSDDIRELHGDLRLDHVYLFPDRQPPSDMSILDGIEFDPALRRIDVVADIAFLIMELSFVGRRDLADAFSDAYFTATRDQCGRALLPLFMAYRSAVRAKVAAILCDEPEISTSEREQALARSHAHWFWALSELELPSRRPALVLVSGLPGTGKSTLAREMATSADFTDIIRTDVVRKELQAVEKSLPAPRYSAAGKEQIYDECLRRARQRLMSGGRVIVDATFQHEETRQRFIQLAIECGVRCVWIECTAPSDVAQRRLDARHGDASDADWSVYQIVASQWDLPTKRTSRFHATVDTGGMATSALYDAKVVLRQFGMIE